MEDASANSTAPSGATVRAERDLLAATGDGAAFSVMVGAGETYVAAFALALGVGGVTAGLLASLPMLAGALMQLASPWAVRRLGSRRLWVVACASVQGLALFALPVAAWFQPAAVWVLFPLTALYWGAGLATGPAWNTWIEEVVPPERRAAFFGRRARLAQVCLLAAFAGSGLLLEWARHGPNLLLYFSLLFLLAGSARFLSAACLAIQSEPSRGQLGERPLEWNGLFRRLHANGSLWVLAFLLAVQTAVQISGPFFAPYMLGQEHLGLSYGQFMVLVAVALLTKACFSPLWGRIAQRGGARRLLWIGGLAIVPVAGLWMVSDNFYWLAFAQMVSGAAWAAYELAMLLIFFEAIPRRERTALLTLYNLGNAAALVVGALIGAAVLRALGEGHFAYQALFVLSSVARLLAAGLLLKVGEVKLSQFVLPVTRIIAVRPSAGAVERPVLPSLPEPSAGESETPAEEPAPETAEVTDSEPAVVAAGQRTAA